MSSCLNYAERLLEHNFNNNPHKPFIVFEDSVFSFADVYLKSKAIAEALKSQGLNNVDRVALSFYNEPDFVFSYFGILLAGGVAVPISPVLAPPEVKSLSEHAGIRLFLSNRSDLEASTLDDLFEKKATFSSRKIPHKALPEDLATIIYTSGTTGDPKGVMLGYSSIQAQVEAAAQVLSLTSDDVFLGILSMSHVFGQMDVLWAALEKSCTVHLIKQFEASAALKSLSQNDISIVIAVPTMYRLMVRLLKKSQFKFSRLRVCHSGAAPTPPELFLEIEKVFGVPFQEGYGLTETCSMAFSNPLFGIRKPGSVGYPIAGTSAKIIDEKGEVLSSGEVGEVCVKGKIITSGYFNNLAATKEAISSSGYLRTGDLGYFDEEGYLFLVDRKKDLIIRSGCKIYPHEVETILRQHPFVEEVAVLGVENDLHGQKVKACIVPVNKGLVEQSELITELKILCAQKLAKFKIPTYFQIVSELPKTHSGKIQRRKLMG